MVADNHQLLFAERALLADGWAENVIFAVGADGRISSIERGAGASGARRLGGPVVPAVANLHSHAFQRAMAGLTEAQCQAQNIPYEKKEYDLADAFPWKRLGETVGYSKILTSPGTGQILGAHVLGHDAEEIINTVALAMRNKLPAQALADAIWAYPTCGYYLRYMV